MATIDLIVLGMLKKEPLSAYDLQKLVEYRNISKWVKISTPSIYKKVIQLEEKGYISSHIEKEGKMPEKSVYSLTEKGKQQFEKLMLEISCKPINIFLDFNAVIVNLDSMSRERQQECLDNIESSMEVLKKYLEENIALKKSKEDIIHSLNQSIANRTYALIKRVDGKGKYILTGGVAQNKGVVQCLEEKLQADIFVSDKAQLCGAIGAALLALE